MERSVSLPVRPSGPALPLCPEEPVHALFERWARETPGAPAVEAGGRSLTYAELNRRANQLAHHLRRLGVGPEALVALRLERSPELVVGALAALKAGGAWLPIDPAHPAERLDFILRDSGAALLLTTGRLALPGLPVEAVALDRLDLSGESREAPTPLPWLGPEQLAYVIYTSGSTGTPKGVELRHRGLARLAAWDREFFGCGPEDRCTLLAGPGFDASVWEMWSALTAGASLHVPPAEALVSPSGLLAWLAGHRITLTFLPTPLGEAVLAEWGERNGRLPEGLALRMLKVGGDRLRRRPGPEHPFPVINLYGPTECTVVATAGRVSLHGDRMPDVGHPIAPARVHVLDGELRPVPPGEPGELCIAGDGLARGYRGQPDLTAAAFVPDPSGGAGARLYRTGDLTRRRPEGELEILGRIDHQVKVRGFRIELGEIEAALGRHPAVREAAVLVREGEERLSAYVALREELPAAGEALRGFLAAALPEYMLPTAWAFLEALPLTPNGKVDRKALARIEPAAGEAEAAGEAAAGAPRNDLEELLAGLFAQVLGLDRAVGRQEDFLQLGGHSLLATRLASRVREVCGVDLGVRGVFESPTVAALAARIGEASREQRPAAPPLAPLPADARAAGAPLSFAQQRLWFLERLRPGTPLYNLTQAYDLAGGLSIPALAAALTGIVVRHEALRTTFVPPADGGEPLQTVAPPEAVPLPLIDLAALPEARQQAEAGRLTAAEARRPYDLERGPLLRAVLLRRDEAGHRLLLGMHHIVSDGWSAQVLVRELSALYRAEPLPPLSIQYRDFAVWQRRWLDGEALQAQLAGWRERLDGAPTVLELPADRPRPPVASLSGAVERLPLGSGLEDELAALSRRSGATLFMTVLAAFQVLLHLFTGQDDLVVGSPVAGRGLLELEPLIGFFVNMLPLRARLAGEQTFSRHLARVRETALAAYAHQDLPFERLVEELVPVRDLAHAPLVQAALALQDALPGLDLGPGIAASAAEVPSGTAKLDLTLFVERRPDGLEAIAEHATDLFDAATMQRLLGSFRTLLSGIVADPEARVSELPLLGPEEMAQIAAGGDAAEVAPVQVHQLFEAQVDRAPGALAVVRGAERLTYAELDARANRLAHRLRRLGVGPESVVAVLLERSPELLVAVLGTLKAGGTWLPIDPAYPAERVLYTLCDAGACALLSAGGPLVALPEIPLPAERIVRLDSDLLSSESAERPSSVPDLGPDLLAYVIYTSGSTGRPKGTALRHRGLANLLTWYVRTYGLGPDDRCSLVAGPGFDASVWEMWSPLVAGASIHIPPREAVLAPAELLAWLAGQGITVAFLPTPLAEVAVAQPLPAGLSLRALMIGGDRLHRRPPAGLPFPLVNLYGPAEATVVSTAATVAAEGSRAPEIGIAIANAHVQVFSRALRPVPEGVVGELCVAGPGLARGYLGRPDLTAARFVPNPFKDGKDSKDGGRLYRTGDLARRLPDGQIELLGRVDQQVKIRGVRIELGEIESAIDACPGVAASAVLVREDRPGDRRLAAYVVAPGAGAEELRAELARRLPEAMLPAAWVFLDEMPLTANGKVDRRALERIAPPEAQGEAEAPRNPVEELLAGLFAEVLGLDRAVGIHDDFFQLGGHSLLAVQLASRVRAAFGADLDLLAVFERPTVAGLAARITAAGQAGPPPVTPAGTGPVAPLSFAQQRLWFLDRFESGTALYNIPVAFRFAGAGLSVPALAGALDEAVRRHQVLRTVFREVPGGDSVQVVRPFAPRGLPVVDLAGLPAGAAEAARLEAEAAERPFDLARGPLLRALLLRLGGEEHRLIVSMHHIVSDGWSVEILVRELSEAYRALAAGRAPALPPLPVQYADFAVWQRAWLAGETLASELAWWRERLAGIPAALELPADRSRPAVQSLRGAVRRAPVEPAVGAALAALSRRQGATLFMTLLAAFDALLHRWTGEEDLVVGTPVANRGQVELEGLIGFFVNTLVLRASAAGDPGFRELLARVRAAALAAYAHQDLPFEQLVAELAPQRDLSHPPVFQVLFSLQETPPPVLDLGPGLAAPLAEVRTATSKLDLSLQLYREGDGMLAVVEHATDLFDAATIDRFLGHLQTLLAGIASAPEARIGDLPLLTEAEQIELLRWDEETRHAHPDELLHGLFEAQAARTPDTWAVVSPGSALTYAELEARSARLAQRLRRLGVGPEVPVGICLTRTTDLIVAMLAVLRSGGFYVPLDPAYPAERLAFLLEDSGAGLILTDHRTDPTDPTDRSDPTPLPPSPALRLRVEDAADTAAAPLPAPEILPGHLAYLIYTSGSTGRPKAVAIEHRSAALLARWARGVFSSEELAGVLASTSTAFDLSVFEIFVTLAWGGTVVVAENALALPALSAPGALPPDVRITLVNTVPSAAAELLRMNGLPPSVRTINLAGEALLRALADQAYQRPETERLYNLYGPSEDTTYSTFVLVEREPERAPSIGRPVSGTRAYVVDRTLRRLPAGVPGELFLAGQGLARGYLGRPELTAERFLPDPFGSEPGGRMYGTKDLARRRPDGTLEYLGRLDHQVKIRGFRIELGEVEAALAACAGVEEHVVVAREDVPGDKRLVAYVVGTATPAGLREELGRRLPAPLVPSVFVVLPALPLTPNGKVDRRALPAPEAVRAGETGFAEPRTDMEKALAGLWAALFGLEKVGVHDRFFDLGGHSLLATRFVSRVRELFGVELPVRAVFEQPTVAGLAPLIEKLIEERPAAAAAAAAGLEAPAGQSTGPLSFGQQRLWFLDRLQPGAAVYNIPLVFAVEGPLAAGILEAALTEVVRRHEALRTVFALDESGDPLQVVTPPAPHRLPVMDLAGLAAPLRQAEAERLLAAEMRRPFDLARGPLLRSLLVRLGERESRLVLSMHHIVSDGWSVGVLLHELRQLSTAFAVGRPSPLPELPMQYADFAAWQRRWLEGEELASQLSWWRERLAGPPPAFDLPADHPRPPVQSLRGGQERRSLGSGLREAVERLGHSRGATPFMTLLAGFAALLHRYTGEEDLWLGTPIANRTRTETEGLIGFFVNTLVLRTDLGGEPTYAGLLARVRETALAAYAHPDLPFERLVEELSPARDLSRSPLFQVLFSVQSERLDRFELAPGVTLITQPDGNGTAKLDLSVTLWTDADGTLVAGAEHSTDLFEPATVQRLLGHLGVLLASAVAAPESPIADLPLLTAEERAQAVTGWNRTEAAVPDAPAHVLVAEQARRNPERPAVVWPGGQISYGDLDRRANRLAHHLRRLGAGPESLVALRLERSPELVIAALAALKAGGAYLPLDPAQPAERLDFMLRDSGASLLLTPERLDGLDLAWESEDDPGLPAADPDGLAYVIYTSGSTGTPKGIELRHRGLANLVAWNQRTFGLGAGDRVTWIAGPGFDASVWEMWSVLTAGAPLHIPPPGLLADPPALLDWLARQAITAAFLPTPLAEAVLAEPLPPGLSLRLLWVGGDRLRRRPSPALPCPLVNLYGPTECTVITTAGTVHLEGERAPEIGLPVANTRNYLLDRALRPVPIGVTGELCVAGEGLARGYRGRPGLTAEWFVPDPFKDEKDGKDSKDGGRLYRTGDLGRRLPDGRIALLGRIDHQVKVRGLRIELGEIEAALQQLPGVQSAVVLVREDRPGEPRLVAWVVPRETEIAIPALRQALAEKLPAAMVPAAFVVLESLPLTPNGKVDRRALPAPEAASPEGAFVAPRTPLEQQIAGIWKEVLHVDRVGLHDSFWDLGGHSLLATRMLSRVAEAFGVNLPLRALFAAPTLGELAEAVGQSVLAAQGEAVDDLLAGLDGLSDEEIQALLAAESELQELA